MIEQRIQRLSPSQRQYLAQRLRETGRTPASSSSEKQVLAWVAAASDVTEDQLYKVAEAKLTTAAIPKQMVLVGSIPRTANGKIDRRQLQHRVTAEPSNEQSSQQSSVAERDLLKIWRRLLGTAALQVDDNVYHFGADSFKSIQFVAMAQEKGWSVSATAVDRHATVRSLARALADPATDAKPGLQPASAIAEAQHSSADNSSSDGVSTEFRRAVLNGVTGGLIKLSAFSDKPALFLIPPKARRIEEFWPLVAQITQYSCFAPTVGEDVAEHRSVEDVAAGFTKQIRQAQPKGPYRLAGKCEGGHIAWVVAQLLVAAGEDVRFLGLINTPNPDRLELVAESFPARWKRRALLLRKRNPFLVPLFVCRRAINWSLRRLRRRVTGERHLVRGGSRMSWLFSPTRYSGHATLFHPTNALPGDAYQTEITYGWGDLAKGGLDICFVPGHSLDFYVTPNVAVFARQLELAIRNRDLFVQESAAV